VTEVWQGKLLLPSICSERGVLGCWRAITCDLHSNEEDHSAGKPPNAPATDFVSAVRNTMPAATMLSSAPTGFERSFAKPECSFAPRHVLFGFANPALWYAQ
jgi:hypothetical protein